MGKNVVKQKSFEFAIKVIRVYQFLCDQKREFVLSEQLLRSGTAVGAMIREAEHAESKADFKHKMSMAQKEINECMYWLELLNATEYLGKKDFEGLNQDAIEIIKLLTAIIKTSKMNT